MGKAGIRGLPGPANVKRLHGIATADDLVHRKFHRLSPNELWITDITEHPTTWIPADEGKLYLCAIKDVRSNKIVGYSIDDRMKASLAVAALSYAIKARPHAGTIVHSDRGSQFRSRSFCESRPSTPPCRTACLKHHSRSSHCCKRTC